MPVTTLNTLLIAFHDSIGAGLTPTANFTPPSGYPLSYLSNSNLYSRTRTPDLTADRQLTWDLGSSVEFNCFLLAGGDPTISTTYRFRAADNSGFTTNVVQSSASLSPLYDISLSSGRVASYIPPYGRLRLYIHSESITKRYLRWHESDASNPLGYLSWGYMRVGLGWQPQAGFQDWRAVSTINGPRGSQKIAREFEFTLGSLTKQEAYDLENMANVLLSTGRVMILPEPLAANTWLNDALLCTFEGAHVKQPVQGTSYSDKKYKTVLLFREVDR